MIGETPERLGLARYVSARHRIDQPFRVPRSPLRDDCHLSHPLEEAAQAVVCLSRSDRCGPSVCLRPWATQFR